VRVCPAKVTMLFAYQCRRRASAPSSRFASSGIRHRPILCHSDSHRRLKSKSSCPLPPVFADGSTGARDVIVAVLWQARPITPLAITNN
jgi:hypothetical protein